MKSANQTLYINRKGRGFIQKKRNPWAVSPRETQAKNYRSS